jgi:NodT family efflux transporter outer membrane factor (OMF) lipoprotein
LPPNPARRRSSNLTDRRSRQSLGAIAGIAGLAAMGGCVVGPNFQKPPAPVVSGYTPDPLPAATVSSPTPGGEAQRFVADQDVPGQWWALFGSPTLNALMDEALKNNPDVAAQQAALRAATETWRAQKASMWPTASASYNLLDQQVSRTLSPPLNSNDYVYALHTPQLSLSYTPDVFGELKRQAEGVEAQAEAQRFTTEATYLTLTSNLVAAVIQEASLRDQIDAAQGSIDSDTAILKLMRRQQALGEISTADVAAQEATLAQAAQTLPPLQKALGQQRDLVADLTGRFPSQSPADGVTLASLRLPPDLPTSLPSKLVEQRPDVRAAEANLHAASAGVGVAIAARLPSFTLAATAGAEALTFNSLFSPQAEFWTLGANVAQPIFDAGALRHKQRAAEASFDQSKAQYRSTVLSAFQNVADTLQALDQDARTLKAAAETRAATIHSLDLARRQLAAGQIGAIPVLNAEQADQTAAGALAQARAARLADTAALFQALGGGWWNRRDILETTEHGRSG